MSRRLYHSDVAAEIARLEKGQARAVRALLLDPTDAEARARLQQIEDEVAAQRKRYARVTEAGGKYVEEASRSRLSAQPSDTPDSAP